MKKFSFSLEPVIKLYTKDEKAAKEVLGKATKVMMVHQDKIVELGEEYDATQEKESKLREGGEDIQTMLAYSNYLYKIKEDIMNQKGLLRNAMLVVTEKRKVLTAAMQKLKAVANIKEKKIIEWKKEVAREEAKNSDDVCARMHIRKMKNDK